MGLRPATRADEPFIAAMLAEAASWERARASSLPARRPPAIPEIADYVAGWGRDGDAGVIAEVAASRPAPAGPTLHAEHPATGSSARTCPAGLGVDPAFQGRGLGTALLAATVQLAREQGSARSA